MNFGKVKSYDDLLQANTRFIKGELKKSPYHGGPLEIDSQALIGKLVSLHTKLRIVTIDGQAGVEGCYSRSLFGKKTITQNRQKPYLNFYIEKSNPHLQQIFSHLKNQPEILFSVFDVDDYRFSNLYGGKLVGKRMRGYRVPVTLQRKAKTQDQLAEVTWNDISWMQWDENRNPYDDALVGCLGKVLTSPDFYMFSVVVDQWCSKKSAEDYILEAVTPSSRKRSRK